MLGINGYTVIREYQNNAMKKGFHYDEEKDCFICMQEKHLKFQRLRECKIFCVNPMD